MEKKNWTPIRIVSKGVAETSKLAIYPMSFVAYLGLFVVVGVVVGGSIESLFGGEDPSFLDPENNESTTGEEIGGAVGLLFAMYLPIRVAESIIKEGE